MAFFRHPIYGLYTYTAVFYLDAPHRWWGAGLPDLRWSQLAAIVTAVAMLRLERNRARPAWYGTFPAIYLILYTLWLWIQSPWALDPALHRECTLLFTKYIVVYFMVYRLIDTPERTADYLLANVAGCLYLGLIALGTSAPGGRLDGVGGPGIDDSNTLGMHAAAVSVVGAMLIFALRDWRRYAAIFAMPLILNMIVKTGSRGAFLALFMGGLAILALRPRENSRLFYGLAVVGVLAFGVVASDAFWARMRTIEAAAQQNQDMDSSAAGRIAQMKAGIVMSSSHPLGVGHRGFAVLSSAYLDPEYLDQTGARASHNTFISALVEQGLPGAILFSLLWLWVLKSCLAARRMARMNRSFLLVSMQAAVCASLVVVFVGGQFADFLKSEIQIWLLALLASLKALSALPASSETSPAQTGREPLRRICKTSQQHPRPSNATAPRAQRVFRRNPAPNHPFPDCRESQTEFRGEAEPPAAHCPESMRSTCAPARSKIA